MSLDTHEITWNNKGVDQALVDDVLASIREQGFVVVRRPESTYEDLRLITGALGPFQRHERADANGIATVYDERESSEIEVYRALDHHRQEPHTDGAYLDGLYSVDNKLRALYPPAIVILQCVTPAHRGGESLLVDFQKVLADRSRTGRVNSTDISDLRAEFSRGEWQTRPRQLFVDGGMSCPSTVRYRNDAVWDIASQSGVTSIEKEYLLNPQYQQRRFLAEGSFLLVDNTRMLHGRSMYWGNRHLRRAWVADQHEVQRRAERISQVRDAIVGDRYFVETDKALKYSWIHSDNQLEFELDRHIGIRLPD